ncbi:MAG: bifunctional methylenetetrahydrofolate dehydrogenase/methenyltetrahydrofolate cyclohydrolase FolD [Candidatus Kapaibacterium sp.]
MTIIDGKHTAACIREELRDAIGMRIAGGRSIPGLALLLVGDNPASAVYVGGKDKACKEIGMRSTILRLPSTATEREVLDILSAWNADPEIHGILVQLPLPKHIDEQRVIMAIDPKKDVDGFHPESVGRLSLGLPGFLPCTPAGIVELLKRYSIPTKGRHAVVVGRSNIVGKPMAALLMRKGEGGDAIVTVCHSAASDIQRYTVQADILIAAGGVPHLIGPRDVKDGAVVIDVGMNRIDDLTRTSGTRLVGDVDFDAVAPKCSAITPVPGGVGPMTIAMLLRNTLKAAENGDTP